MARTTRRNTQIHPDTTDVQADSFSFGATQTGITSDREGDDGVAMLDPDESQVITERERVRAPRPEI